MDKVLSLFGLVVYLAMLAVVLGSSYTASIISSLLNGFGNLINAAKG